MIGKTVDKLKKPFVFFLAVLTFVTSVPIQVNAENAMIEEILISEDIPDFSTVSVDSQAVTLENFIWPNEYGQYSYTYNEAKNGNKYMLLVLAGVYKSLDGIERDELISNLIYLDQTTAEGTSVSFKGFIPAKEENSTVILSGEGITPRIVGYISKDIFKFGLYVNQPGGEQILSDTYTVERNTTWTDFKDTLPHSAYMEIYSDYMDTLYLPVNLIWRDSESFNTTKVGNANRIIADAVPADGVEMGNFAQLIKPFIAYVTVKDKLGLPIILTAGKLKCTYNIGEIISDSDISVSAIYDDGTVRGVTGWTADTALISTAEAGIKYITITYTEGEATVSTRIPIRVREADSGSTQQYIVSYVTNGGTCIEPSIVDAGTTLLLPETPEKNGFKFAGWYTDRYGTTAFNEETVIDCDMVLYAHWIDESEPLLYNLRVYLTNYNIEQGDVLTRDMISATAVYDDGSTKFIDAFDCNIDEIDQQTPGVKTLTVRYTEGNITKQTDVSFRIFVSDVQETYIVDFATGCEQTITPQKVIAGETVSEPYITVRKEGFIFAGWYYQGRKWSFDTDSVNENMVLTAKWLKSYGEDSDIWGFVEEGQIFEFTGKAIKPDFVIMDNNLNILTAKKDYTVKYENNIKPSTEENKAKAIITGKGNYTGSTQIQFTITAKNIADTDKVTVDFNQFNGYKAAGYTPIPKIKYNGKTLKNGTDFEITCMKLEDYSSEEGIPVKGGKLVDSGYYKVIVSGKGNYAGTIELPYQIAPEGYKSLAKASIKIDKNYKKVTYTGKPVNLSFAVKVSFGKDTLIEGKDYQIVYPENNIDIGKKTVIVRALHTSGMCYGEKSFTYEITGIALKASDIVLENNKVDFCNALISDNISSVSVKLDKNKAQVISRYYGKNFSAGSTYVLGENKDYKVSYKNNEKAGKASVEVQGIGVFSGTVKKNFTINGISLKSENILIELVNSNVMQSKAGASVKVRVKYTCNDKTVTLAEGKDYSLKYKNNDKAGERAVVTISGKGNYSSSVERNFSIVEKPFSSRAVKVSVDNPVQIDNSGDYVYKPKLLLTDDGCALKEKKDYLVDYTKCITQDEVSKGRTVGYVTITEKDGGSYSGSRVVAYQVIPNSIASKDCSITIKEQIYTGAPVEFNFDSITDKEAFESVITLKNGSMVQLIPGVDFDVVEYSKNTACGKATAVIKGIGRYTGTKKVTFIIKQKELR